MAIFQAEDGIRDAQESRGLGDVYKRQVPGLLCGVVCVFLRLAILVEHRLVTDTDRHRHIPREHSMRGKNGVVWSGYGLPKVSGNVTI